MHASHWVALYVNVYRISRHLRAAEHRPAMIQCSVSAAGTSMTSSQQVTCKPAPDNHSIDPQRPCNACRKVWVEAYECMAWPPTGVLPLQGAMGRWGHADP